MCKKRCEFFYKMLKLVNFFLLSLLQKFVKKKIINCKNDGDWVVQRSLFPRKEETFEWLSHISRIRNFGVVHSHMLTTSSIICISPRWSSVMATCVICCSLKSLRITSLHHMPDLDWDVHLCQKNYTNCFSHLDLY